MKRSDRGSLGRLLSAVSVALALGGVACSPEEEIFSAGPAAAAEASAAHDPCPAVAGLEEPGLPLTLDRVATHDIRPGQRHRHALDLAAGTFVHLVVEQHGVDVVTTLCDPAGEPVIEADRDISYDGPEPLLAVAEAAGRYTVVVHAPLRDRPAGHYQLRLLEKRPAAEGDRARAVALKQVMEGEDPEAFGAALEIWRQSGERFWQAETLLHLGWWHAVDRQVEEAVDAFRQSAELFRQLEDPVMTARALNLAGNTLLDADRIDEAIEHHRAALALQQQAGDRLGQAVSFNNLGQAYRVKGEFQAAKEHYERALGRWDEALDGLDKAQSHSDLGTLLRVLGRPVDAIDHLEAAIERSRKGSANEIRRNRVLRAALNQLGRTHLQLGDPEAALPYLREALQLQDRPLGRANTRINIGLAQRAFGRPEKARAQYEEALALLRDPSVRGTDRALAKVLVALGSLEHADGKADQALELLREARDLYRRMGHPAGEAESLMRIAEARAALGRLQAARRAAEQAIELVEKMRLGAFSPELRASFFSTVTPFFEWMVDLSMALDRRQPGAGYDALALEISERGRARSFADLLAEAGADLRDGAVTAQLEREKDLQSRYSQTAASFLQLHDLELDGAGVRHRIAELGKELRDLRLKLDAIRSEIRRLSPRHASLTRPEPLTTAEIQQQLDADTQLLVYELAEKRSFAWLVGAGSLQAFELAGRSEIEPRVRETYELLGSHRRGVEPEIELGMERLSDLLLAPLGAQLNAPRLVIVADEVLQYLPFAALLKPDGEPLIADHEIVLEPSVTALAQLRRAADRSSAPGSGLLAVMADSVFGTDDERVTVEPPDGRNPAAFERLRFARREGEAILSLAPPGERVLSAFGFAAGKDLILEGGLSDFQILHFATHADLFPEQAGLAYLVLSLVDENGEPQDGFLHADELYNLRLSADLAVLSACKTALGHEVRGEGLIGLTRGFMYAGVSRVVVSLWNVSSRGTLQLMEAFYRNLFELDLEPAAALRRAQNERRRSGEPVAVWAAFVHQGEWRPR